MKQLNLSKMGFFNSRYIKFRLYFRKNTSNLHFLEFNKNNTKNCKININFCLIVSTLILRNLYFILRRKVKKKLRIFLLKNYFLTKKHMSFPSINFYNNKERLSNN